MFAMTLPPVNPAPVPTQLLAPPAPAGPNNNATGPGSFSQLLEAADARRQAEARAPSPAPAPAPAPAAEKKAQNTQTGARPAATAQRAPSHEGSKREHAAGQSESENNTAERAGAAAASDEAGSAGCSAPADPTSLLASLGLTHRANLAQAPAETGSARGRGGLGRERLQSSIDAGQARTGTAADAAAALGDITADVNTSESASASTRDTASASAAHRSSAGQAFAGLLAAAQGAEAAADATTTLAVTDQRLALQAEARPADASALGALVGAGAAPAASVTGGTGGSAAHPAEARLSTSPGQAGFAEQLGAQLSSFVREGVQHARLQLHPLELGPVTVQIQLDGGNAHMSFAAEHAHTRQALEQALPTLAGSLREAGLTLSGGGVFEQPRQPQPEGDGSRGAGGDGGSGSRAGRGGNGGGDDSLLQASPGPTQRRRGVVDLVA